MVKSRTVIKGHEGRARVKEDVKGTLPATTYYYAVASVVSGVTDTLSMVKQDSVVLSAVGSTMIAWDKVSGASEYKIFRTKINPSAITGFGNSIIATIPATSDNCWFVDDGYAYVGSSAGTYGAGTSTPTVYANSETPMTRIPVTFSEFAFQEISIDTDEGYSAHAHGGDRTKTHAPGSIDIKGSIKRYMTCGRFLGAVMGWDRAGTTNAGQSYPNEVVGDGTGTFDGTTFTTTTCEQSPIARRKPKFALQLTFNKDDATPTVLNLTNVSFTDHKTGIPNSDKEVVETIGFVAEGRYAQYDASLSFA
jgi:hypothetical protein